MPHLPSLDIGEGALDELLKTYRDQLSVWGGYLCEAGVINFERLESLLVHMGAAESAIFNARAVDMEKHAKRKKKDEKQKAAMLAAAGVPLQNVRPAAAVTAPAADGDEFSGAGAADDSDEPWSDAVPVGMPSGEAGKALALSDISPAARAAAELDLLRSVGARLCAERRAARAALGVVDAAADAADEAEVAAFTFSEDDFKGRYYLDKVRYVFCARARAI